MTTRVNHGTGHVAHGVPEFVGDSRRGIDEAAARGERWWDLNWLGDWNAHYLDPLAHGFVDPEGKLKRSTPITAMSHDEVRRLVATYQGQRYQVRLMVDQVLYALARGLHVEAEPKRRLPAAAFAELHAAIVKAGKDPKRVLVKVGLWHPGEPWLWLKPAHDYFPTLALTHGERGEADPERFAVMPASAQGYVDEFRGLEPRWQAGK